MYATPTESEDTSKDHLPVRKACDTCRARKIKCDRKAPACSSCVASRVECRTSDRQPERKQRILISAGYEKEIREVNEKLAEISKSINKLVIPSTAAVVTKTRTQPHRTTTTLTDDHDNGYEGASSFRVHSQQVSKAFGEVSDLRGLPLTFAPATNDPKPRPSHASFDNGFISSDLPQATIVLQMLRKAKTNPNRYFPGLSDLNITRLSEMCQNLYFPTEQQTPASTIVTITGIWKLLGNFEVAESQQLGFDRAEIQQAKNLCESSLDRASRSLPIFLEQSYIQVQAVMLLSAYMLETSRPSQAQVLASACMRLCQDLGYHRLHSKANDAGTQRKIMMFWIVFTMERGLSLNFGKSSTLQDYDIATSRPLLLNSPHPYGDYGTFISAIGADLGFLEGDIYQQLFSARAETESRAILAIRVPALAERAMRLHYHLSAFETGDDIMANDMIGAYDLVVQSHLALIYRVTPSPYGNTPLHFSDECVAASRATMEGHNRAWDGYRRRTDTVWKSFINWSYLFSPFVAFIVLFGTVVTTRNEADLQLMQASIETLRAAAEHSDGIAKLYTACETFYNLARVYMKQESEADREQANASQMASIDSFETSAFYQQDWNTMLNNWELGIGGENAREMSVFLSESFPVWPGS